jgi:hypothetical protein
VSSVARSGPAAATPIESGNGFQRVADVSDGPITKVRDGAGRWSADCSTDALRLARSCSKKLSDRLRAKSTQRSDTTRFWEGGGRAAEGSMLWLSGRYVPSGSNLVWQARGQTTGATQSGMANLLA